MKKEIKIERLLNKIENMKQEVSDLEQSLIEPADPSEQYKDAAQPIAPAVAEKNWQGEEFTDHSVTRGANY